MESTDVIDEFNLEFKKLCDTFKKDHKKLLDKYELKLKNGKEDVIDLTSETKTNDDLSSLNVSKLRKLCSERGIRGYNNKKKSELLEILKEK